MTRDFHRARLGKIMSTLAKPFTLRFPEDFDAQSEFETPSRGYLSDVVVQSSNGSCYRLFFYDPVRMRQDLDAAVAAGKPYLAEPNLIVLSEVTTENIERAVQGLWRDGFFEHLKPS
jgi:hypothetical protein